jgi:cytochrome c oxidase subunit IV
MATNTAHAHDSEHVHVHGGPKVYGAVLGALIVLTVITVAASYIHWGSGLANVIIAMLIASIKASLVALFFMHLRWDKPISAIIFVVSLFFLGLFLIGCYTDAVSRPPTEPTNMKSVYAPGGLQGPAQGQVAPLGGPQGAPMTPSGPGQPIPGASQSGSHGGAATGTTQPSPQTPH